MGKMAGWLGSFAMAFLVLAACQSPADLGMEEPPADTLLFPIDHTASTPSAPTQYKGLPMGLVERLPPTVTPVDGVIGVVCVGMSNSFQECQMYAATLAQSWRAQVNPQVRFANCARGGHAIERWVDPAFDAVLWQECIDTILPATGISRAQVRVLFHKAANQFTTAPGGGALPLFPDPASDYFAFFRNLTAFAERVPQWFPSAQAVYSSSRSYGGFSPNPARGEPLSYEEGHALNSWLRANPQVAGVWHGWGPYLWAPECSTGIRNGGGICWNRSDYVDDGVHPSQNGRLKVAELLHARWLQEAWYRHP